MAYDPHKGTSLTASFDELSGRKSSSGEFGAGIILYVNNDTSNLPEGAEVGADRSHFGQDALHPLATIDYAIGLCKAGRGDKIIVLPGHAETVTAAITLDVAGVTIEGRGQGATRAQINCATASIDILTITAADCKVRGLRFNAVTGAVDSCINIAGSQCVVSDCEFLCGASNTNPIITIPDAGDQCLIENNEFRITANGPAIGISIESASCDRGVIRGNLFNGGSGTNQWDTAAINSGVAHTNYIIEKNTFLYGVAHAAASSVSTLIRENVYGVGATPSAATPITFYVDNGSTIRDGLNPATPTTLADALSKARDGVGDKVRLLPGTYTLTATATVSDAALSIGPFLDNGTANVIITTASDVDLFTVTGANVEIFGLRFVGNAAQTTTPMLISLATGDYCNIHDCHFDCVGVASLIAINIASGSTDNKIHRNYFVAGVASVGYVTSVGGRSYVKFNEFDCTAADAAAIDLSTNAVLGSVFAENHIQGDAGSNAAMILLDTSAPVQFACYKNIFTGTTSATPFGQDTEYTTMFVENYVATGNGGALIDVTA